MAITQPLTFSAAQAAQLFGVTPQTLHNWRVKGYLRAVQLPNGRYTVPVEEIERILGSALKTNTAEVSL